MEPILIGKELFTAHNGACSSTGQKAKMITLKLFNAVLAQPTKQTSPFISENGLVIEPGALWAKWRIISYYDKERLSGNDFNKTFFKSWKRIKELSLVEMAYQHVLHYLSIYGTDFTGDIYIPGGVMNVPEVELNFKLIRAYSKEKMTEKCLDFLRSGIALKEETLKELLTVLTDELGYQFTGKEGIRNKEAIVKIADMYRVY